LKAEAPTPETGYHRAYMRGCKRLNTIITENVYREQELHIQLGLRLYQGKNIVG